MVCRWIYGVWTQNKEVVILLVKGSLFVLIMIAFHMYLGTRVSRISVAPIKNSPNTFRKARMSTARFIPAVTDY